MSDQVVAIHPPRKLAPLESSAFEYKDRKSSPASDSLWKNIALGFFIFTTVALAVALGLREVTRPASITSVTLTVQNTTSGTSTVKNTTCVCTNTTTTSTVAATPTCGSSDMISKFQLPHTYTPTAKENKSSMFKELTTEEITAVHTFLTGASQIALNIVDLSTIDPAAVNVLQKNYINRMELFTPNKAQALSYLDGTGAVPPDRYARVWVSRGEDATPTCAEYKVGPLGGTLALTNHKTGVDFNIRRVDSFEYAALDTFLRDKVTPLNALMTASYGGTLSDGVVTYTDTAPRAYNAAERYTIFFFLRKVQGKYAHPIGLEVVVSHAGPNIATWSVFSVLYNNVEFRGATAVADLAAAFTSASAATPSGLLAGKLITQMYDAAVAKASTFEPRGAPRALEHLPPPRQIMPAGNRFTVTDDLRVYYMGWSFLYNIRPTTGPIAWDIRFKGERIIYEMSLQEALASYGGWSLFESATFYLDTNWAMGSAMYELAPGYDCPAHAVYRDISQWNMLSPSVKKFMTFKKAVCFFEHNAHVPLRRHYDNNGDGTYDTFAGVETTYLVARVITAVYNYDYVYDFIFHATGAVEIRCQTTGYLQAAFFHQLDATEYAKYGPRILNYTTTSVHDHIILYKIDIDIAGTSNNFDSVTMKQKSVLGLPGHQATGFAANNDANGWKQRQLEHYIVPTENDAKARQTYDQSDPALWIISNPDALNKWGSKRGYRVSLNAPCKTLLDTAATVIVPWAKYNFGVTKFKDTEAMVSTVYDQTLMSVPSQNTTSWYDGDSLVRQDLVAWASIGLQHMPHAEDIPVTTTIGNSGSIYIRPVNYFDEDASMDLRHSVFKRSTSSAVEYASDAASTCSSEANTFSYDGNLEFF